MSEPSDRPPWMPPSDYSPDARPSWNQEEANDLVGKYVLVGVTYLKSDGKTVRAKGQYHGRIVGVDRQGGFKIECEGRWKGETMGLPPHLEALRPAKPGKYELHTTGEVVVDPDYVTTWSIADPVKS